MAVVRKDQLESVAAELLLLTVQNAPTVIGAAAADEDRVLPGRRPRESGDDAEHNPVPDEAVTLHGIVSFDHATDERDVCVDVASGDRR